MSKAVKTSTMRARHAATIKKTIDSINAFTNTTCASTLIVFKDELESAWSAYNNAFLEHEDAIIGKDQDELTAITTEFATIHTAYLKCRILLTRLMTGTNATSTGQLPHPSNNDNIKTIKLPPCKLMNFSGELKDWVEFKATCRSMLTDKVPDIQRLQFLKEALKGEPRELVAHILPGDGFYERAMLLLKNRYENTRAIVNDHLKRLYTLPRNDPEKENVAQ